MRSKVALIFFVCALATIGTQARLPIPDFGLPPNLADNIQTSLHLSVDVWKLPVADANRLAGEARISPDDFMVAAFLSNRSGSGIQAVWNLRRTGLPWVQVALRLGVPMDTVIVRPGRDYGPPYGKAWGYWKNHGHGKGHQEREEYALNDPEFIAMARVQTLCRATGRTPDEVISGLQGGRDYHAWCGEVYREHHGHGPKGQGAKEHGRGQGEEGPPGLRNKEHGNEEHGGEGHGNGHGHGHGH